jgi:hypothetical protein
MALQAKVTEIESVPEALRSSYVERDGAYHLDVEGMVDKTKLDDFRRNNVKLLKDLEAMQGKFKDVDLDQYAELLKASNAGKDKKLIEAGKIDELVEERTKRMRETHNSELSKIQGENDIQKRQLEGLMIDAAVRDSANKQGVANTAMDDVILRAKTVFKLKDGQATPFDKEGGVIYASGTSDAMSVDQWVKGLTGTAPHLFTPSNGGGSQHGNRSGKDGATVTRSEFDGMNQHSRSEFAKKGGKVVD